MLKLTEALQAKATNITTVEKLRVALQAAIELEHSTIPPYLYALYSLKPGQNTAIGELIRSVVWEEMSHMSLACNMLNAIGGAPDIDKPDFIPHYPGPLPGTVEDNLIVPLAPFSPQLLKDVFMVIEEPEDPLNYPVVPGFKLMADAPPLTIGQFYENIRAGFQYLHDHGIDVFTGNPDKQLGSWGIGKVTDLASAKQAIGTIIEQGEGSHDSPDATGFEGVKELAHYYRFAEIYHGRQLVPTPAVPTEAVAAATAPAPKEAFAPVGALAPAAALASGEVQYDPGYSYSGPPIVFYPAGVWPAMLNPARGKYPTGSAVGYLNQRFNYTYTGLLKALHRTFNGDPGYINTAIGMMESLKGLALELMATPIVAGGLVNAGPSFEYELFLPQE